MNFSVWEWLWSLEQGQELRLLPEKKKKISLLCFCCVPVDVVLPRRIPGSFWWHGTMLHPGKGNFWHKAVPKLLVWTLGGDFGRKGNSSSIEGSPAKLSQVKSLRDSEQEGNSSGNIQGREE